MRETDPEWHGIPVFSMYSSGLAGENTKDSLLYYLNGSGEDVYASLPRELAAKGDYVLLANTDTGEANPEGIVRYPKSSLSRLCHQLSYAEFPVYYRPPANLQSH